MLGFGPLGQFALGQVAAPQAGDATAFGDTIVLNLSLIAGTATGEGQQPPIVILPGGGFRRQHHDGVARGALIILDLWLYPGHAAGVADGTAAGTVLLLHTGIAAGQASGFDAIAHDNEFILHLLAA